MARMIGNPVAVGDAETGRLQCNSTHVSAIRHIASPHSMPIRRASPRRATVGETAIRHPLRVSN